jgi:hypothetical protein
VHLLSTLPELTFSQVELKPRVINQRKKHDEEPKDSKDSKAKGKWVPFPEPVPVAPRHEADYEGRHRGDPARRGRGGARGGAGRGGGRGGGQFRRGPAPGASADYPGGIAADGSSGAVLSYDAPAYQPYGYDPAYAGCKSCSLLCSFLTAAARLAP